MYSATCTPDHELWEKCSANPGEYTTADLCPLDYGGSGDGCQPPNLITTLMNMALMPGSVDEPLYAGQAQIQVLLLLVAVGCVPWLLIVKPMLLKKRMDKQEEERRSFSEPFLADKEAVGDFEKGGHGPDEHGEGAHEEHDFTELLIHQAIETIEFVLGMVSNTASYLRLWALSLAHTELAQVFWEKCMLSMINLGNPIAIVCGYAVFAAVTFAVLLAMDVLECFLHALRLHWVEFQNKFYKADGYKFKPFALQPILRAAI